MKSETPLVSERLKGFVPFVPAFNYKHRKPRKATKHKGAFYSFARYAIADALRGLENSPGTVLLPALCCNTLVEAVKKSGNEPAFYDIPENFEIGIDELHHCLSTEIVAIIAISYFGWETVQIQQIAENVPSKIFCLIDSAQSLPLENHENIFDRVYSFRKSLGIPDGAVLISKKFPSRNNQRAQRKKSLIFHREADLIRIIGESKGWTDFNQIKCYLDERNEIRRSRVFDWSLAAPSELAITTWETTNFEEIAFARRQNAETYCEMLNNIHKVRIAFEQIPNNSSPLAFPIWVEDAEVFSQELWKFGIETARWWKEIPVENRKGEFPNSYRASRCLVQLPVHQNLEHKDIVRIVDVVNSVVSS